MKNNFLLLLLSSLTISNSSSDVLNAKGSPASITSLVAPTIQNITDPSTKNETDTETTTKNKTYNKTTPYTSGKFLPATKNTITTQPKGRHSGPAISEEAIVFISISTPLILGCLGRCCIASRTTTPRTTTNTQVDNQEQSADIIDINQEQSATPRTTTSSMTGKPLALGYKYSLVGTVEAHCF